MPENSSTQKAPSGFPVWESSLAVRIGVSRNVVAVAREASLVQGSDWIFYRRRIVLTDAAAEKLAAHFRATPLETNGASEPATHVPEVIFKVHPRKCANPRILLATDGTNLVRVRVKAKEKFRPGMPIRCTQLGEGLYQIVGNHPRFNGKY